MQCIQSRSVLNSENFDTKHAYIQHYSRHIPLHEISGANRLDIPGANMFWCETSGYLTPQPVAKIYIMNRDEVPLSIAKTGHLQKTVNTFVQCFSNL